MRSSRKRNNSRSRKSISILFVLITVIGLVLATVFVQKNQNIKAKADFVPLWAGDMEEGKLDDWFNPGTEASPGCCYGGDMQNSGQYEAIASTDFAHSGTYSLRAKIWTPATPTSGVRAFRWQEPHSNRDAYYSGWFYLPTSYTLTADPSNGQFWNLFQFKSRTQDDSRIDPLWGLYAKPDGNGGLYLRAGWGWGNATLAGPYSTSNVGGKWIEPTTRVSLPIGRWFKLEAFLHQSKDFDGHLTFWQDGVQILDLPNVRTSYANCNYNSWCASNEWSLNNYSDGLSPNPATIYIDDAVISLTRVSGPSLTPTPTTVPTTPTPVPPTPTPTPVSTDTTPPSVLIVAPSNGATVKRGSTVTITANASDNVGVTKVEFYVNNVLKTPADTTYPYTYSWSVPSKPNVTYTLKAVAYDAKNNSSSSTVSVTAR